MVLGISAVLGLSFLPKVVVKKKQSALALENPAVLETDVLPLDHKTLDALDQREVDSLSTAFQTADPATKEAKLERLIEKLTYLNRYDSAAYYAEQYWKETQENKDLLRAANLFYDTFTYASFDPAKAKSYGLKTKDLFAKYVFVNKKNLEARVKLGTVMVSVDNPMNGIFVIREVLNEDPTNKSALFQLGLFSMESGQYDKAVGRFATLSELEPNNIQYRFYHGVSLAESGQREAALVELDYVKTNTERQDLLDAVEEYAAKLTSQQDPS